MIPFQPIQMPGLMAGGRPMSGTPEPAQPPLLRPNPPAQIRPIEMSPEAGAPRVYPGMNLR